MRVPWRRRAANTPAPAETDSAHAALLAQYAAVSRQAHTVDRERRRLRKLVDEIPEGTHGGWRKRLGAPAEIVDIDAVRALLDERRLPMPMKPAAGRLEVVYVGDAQEGPR